MSRRATTVSGPPRTSAAAGAFNWLIHGGFVFCAILHVLLYASVYRSLIDTWANTGTYEYAFLILPICAVLIWSRRRWLTCVSARPRPSAALAVFAIGLLWLCGVLAHINLAQHIAAIVIWPALVYGFYGRAVVSALVFPLSYMLFAIPFGDFMVEPLQTVTAHLSVAALRLTDIPVFMSGHFIDTPAAAWHVAEACSGVKFFVATTAFGVLYSYLFFRSTARRLVFVACAMVVPVLANGLRVFFTILIGEAFGIEYATGTDHMVFGWQFFGAVLVILFFAGWPWHQAPESPPAQVDAYWVPSSTMWRVFGIMAIAVAVPALWLAGARAQMPAQLSPVGLPSTLAGLSSSDAMFYNGPTPTFAAAQVRTSREYEGSDRMARAEYVGYPADSEADPTSRWRALYDADSWRGTAPSVVVSPEQSYGHPVFVATTLTPAHGGRPWQLAYTYRVGSRWTTSPAAVKLWQVLYGLTWQPATVGVLWFAERVDSEVASSSSGAIAELAAAVNDGSP